MFPTARPFCPPLPSKPGLKNGSFPYVREWIWASAVGKTNYNEDVSQGTNSPVLNVCARKNGKGRKVGQMMFEICFLLLKNPKTIF